MKTRLLLIAVSLIPFFLNGQGVVQKQSYTPTSTAGYQGQTNQVSVQTNYQPQQTYQPVQQYTQPVNQQVRVEKQMNTQLQSGYTTNNNYPNSYSGISSSNREKLIASEALGLQTIAKPGTLNKRNTVDRPKQEVGNIEFAKKETSVKPNLLVNTLSDSSSGLSPLPQVNEVYTIQKTIPQRPELVYKLTPTFRLRYVCGGFAGWNDLNGYGVHIATFVNYNYCVGVAKYIRKKYHATAYVFEDQAGYPHFHLVFGRWQNVISAEIFEGKVRREAPHAFVCLWRNDFSVLLPNGNIMQPF